MGEELNPKPANLVDADWKHGSSDGEIFVVIRDGVKNTGMKPYARKIKTDDIWNVVNYVRSIGPSHMKIVVADDLPASSLDLLRSEAGWVVDAQSGRPPDVLAADLADADALLVRSATKVDARPDGRGAEPAHCRAGGDRRRQRRRARRQAAAASSSSMRRARTASASPSTPAR